MGKSTISMAIFNSWIKLPVGNFSWFFTTWRRGDLGQDACAVRASKYLSMCLDAVRGSDLDNHHFEVREITCNHL
jgi:hypothetical protein